MDLLKTLTSVAGDANIEQLGRQFGLDSSATRQVLGQLVPALGRGLQNNAGSVDGLAGLSNALQSGNHQRYLEDAGLISQPASVEDGNRILGHIFGSKDVSRNVAAQAAGQTGIDPGVIRQMLPLVATMVMGSLNRQTSGGQSLGGGGGVELLGSLLGGAGKDSGLDDVLNLAKKFF